MKIKELKIKFIKKKYKNINLQCAYNRAGNLGYDR